MKYTIVTGAASDIGKAISINLAENGHCILMIDIDKESMDNTIKLLPFSDKHLSLVVDFSNIEESEDIIKKFILDNNIEIKHAVFAAGIFSIKPLRMLTHNYFQKSFDIAVYSIIQIMQIVTSKKINKDNFESAVIISSIAAKVGTKGYVLYSGVKAALLGITHSLAVEFAPNIRINSILPGSIKTKATAFIYNSVENANPRSLLGEGQPIDIAKLINFLLSDNSRWITGQEFIIDGGCMIN